MIGEVLDGFMHADLISELVKLVVSSSKQRKGESVLTEFRFMRICISRRRNYLKERIVQRKGELKRN
jgi:hypothetical protein